MVFLMARSSLIVRTSFIMRGGVVGGVWVFGLGLCGKFEVPRWALSLESGRLVGQRQDLW
jgi:hypothetical protein